MTFPPKPLDSVPYQTSTGSPADFGACSYDSREDLPIREWNGKGRKQKGTESFSENNDVEDTPFGQLIRAAEFLTNEEKRSSSEATPETEEGTGKEAKAGKRKARAEPERKAG